MSQKLGTIAATAVLFGGLIAACSGTSPSGSAQSNAQVTAALETSAAEMDPEVDRSNSTDMDGAVSHFESVLNELRQVPELAPLFTEHQIPNPVRYDEDDDQSWGLITMLRSVRFSVSNGILTITNRETGGVIYTAPLSDIGSGVFDPANLPTTTDQPQTACTAFTYSAWGACQSNGTQTRTVTASSPTGCTGGSPVLSESCTPPTTTACTSFTYSTWGACQSNGTQTRTVLLASPTGCTGGSPVLSESCTYTPPVTACTSFTYSAWGACQTDGTQTRTVTASSPSGCTGGSPVTSETCTYVPPVTACTYTYSAWGACQSNGTQTRTVASSSPTGCTGTPVLSQACTYAAPNPVTSQNVTTTCTACHGLTSNTTVFGSGGYTISGDTSAQWLSIVNSMVSKGAQLAAGTTAQNYADYLAGVP